MSSKHTLIAAIAGAFGTGLGWKNRKAAAADRRARQKAKRAEQARRQREGMER
ncbi:hypothetical protein [Salinicola corii]|uniref:hypothetical protein n=1 Tax=Salinicola corii TaxID=2606937 RepID=UPI001658F513|nr:hypothetical protein [Salinicola corii]